jgi:outer membrane protein assembly factor BamB
MRRGVLAFVLVCCVACASGPHAPAACTPAGARGEARRWTVDLPSAPAALAADADGAVITFDRGVVMAVDRRGARVWEVPVAGAGLDWPVIDGDLVVVPTSVGDRAGCTGLDRGTGATRWRVDAGPGAVAATAVSGDVVLCASAAGLVVTADRDTGADWWRADLAARAGVEVAVSPRTSLAVSPDGLVALTLRIGGRWALTCLALADGAERCLYNLGAAGPPSAPVFTAPGRLVVGVGDRPMVMVLDLGADTAPLGVPTHDAFDPASIPLVLDGGVVVVVDRGGGVTAVDAVGEELQWRARLDLPALDARPVAAGPSVFVTDFARTLAAFDRDTGDRDTGRAALAAEPGVVAVAADPGSGLLATAWRGAAGHRLEVGPAPGSGEARPLQCPVEPGQSIRNEARPQPRGGADRANGPALARAEAEPREARPWPS